MEKNINLTLKTFGCYQKTQKGVFFYTSHGFKIFVPIKLLKQVIRLHFS